MLFSELAVQNVAGFPPTARLALKAGLNAVVTKDADLVRLLRVVLYGDGGAQQLCSGNGPHKGALTILGADGHSWRVVRDLSTGHQSLLRSDPTTRQAQRVAEEHAEVARWLGQSIGLPGEAALKALLTLGANDLPSRAAQRDAMARMATNPAISRMPTSPGLPVTSALAADVTLPASAAEARQRLPALRDELTRAESFERAQDELYELQNRFGEFSKGLGPIQELEGQIRELEQKAAGMRGQADFGAGLEAKIRRFPEAAARREAALVELRKKREEYEKNLAAAADPRDMLRDPLIGGGAGAGALATLCALLLDVQPLFLANIVAFGVAAFGAWKWVARAEDDERGRRRLSDLVELEKRIHRQFELDTQPVHQAMKQLRVGTPEDVLNLLQEYDLVEARKVALQRELDNRRADPRLLALEQERAKLETDLRSREAIVNGLGFTREVGAIRRELQAVEEVAASGLGEVEDPLPIAIERASALVRLAPPAFLESFKDRLAQYLGALTDNRFVGVRALSPGNYHVIAANGAAGPLSGLPMHDRDLIYVAVRLGLCERIAAPSKFPVLFDDPAQLVDVPHRGLFVKMLRALGALTQVLVRTPEAPPASAVDHIAAPGA